MRVVLLRTPRVLGKLRYFHRVRTVQTWWCAIFWGYKSWSSNTALQSLYGETPGWTLWKRQEMSLCSVVCTCISMENSNGGVRPSILTRVHDDSGAMKMRQVPCISGPCVKDLSVFGYGRYWDHLSLYGYMERIEIQNHSRNKAWDSWKDHWSLFTADLFCNWKFRKQLNGYSYKKYMATPCTESMEGFYFERISDST